MMCETPGDVEAAGGDVGGHEQRQAPVLERDHHAVARALGHVAVERLDVHPAVAQRPVQLIAADLRAHEHDRLLGPLGVAAPRPARSGFSRGATSRANCSTVSTVSVAVLTLIVTGSYRYWSARRRISGGIVAENSAVCRLDGRQREDPLDVLEEAEVEHLVGLVEDDEPARVEHQRVARDQVLDPADGADHDVAAGAQLRLLAADRRAAEHGDDVDSLALPVGAQRLRDLDAELAGRRQHEPLDLVLGGIDVLEHRQPERRRLARAGLRLADHVRPREQQAGSPAPGSGWATRSRRRESPRGWSGARPRSANVVMCEWTIDGPGRRG